VLIENVSTATVSGLNNWLQTNAALGPLAASITSASPGFRNPAQKDFTLTGSSICIGAASPAIYGLPGREYFQNEATNRFWRIRAAARDLGAFESSTTNSALGPYDPVPQPRLTIAKSGANLLLSWPLFAQDFQLYHSNFTVPLIWSLSPDSPVTNLDGLLTSFTNGARSDFFRLQK